VRSGEPPSNGGLTGPPISDPGSPSTDSAASSLQRDARSYCHQLSADDRPCSWCDGLGRELPPAEPQPSTMGDVRVNPPERAS
jgi:hypothetical protein